MIWAHFGKMSIKHCGKSIYLRSISSDIKGLYNLSIGDSTSIPKGSTFYCTKAEPRIGNKMILDTKPTIITGDYRIDIIGKHIIDINDSEKLPKQDQPVVIEDEVWCGANVTILKDVTTGRGSVIAAGAVITKSCPPYSIVGGVPAKVLKYRFTIDEALKHEAKLYPKDNRYTRKELAESRKEEIFNPELSTKHVLDIK